MLPGAGESGTPLTARRPRAKHTLGLTSDSRQEAREAIKHLREETRRAKARSMQEWRKQTNLFRALWVDRMESTATFQSQSPRMKGGDHRLAASQNRPWYTAVSSSQGEKLRRQRELQWVARRVAAVKKKQVLLPRPPPKDENHAESDGPVWTCCSWSPNGRRIVLGAEDSSAVMVGASTFDVVYKLQGIWQHATNCCSWSPDGLHYCIGAGDCSAVVVEAATGTLLQTIAGVHTQPILCCSFSPDGSLICLGASDGTASLVSAADGGLVHQIQMTEGRSVSVCGFSPDGLVLCLGSDVSTALLVDVTTGRPVRRISNVSGPSMVTSLFHDSRLPRQMDFLESLTPRSTVSSAVRPPPAPIQKDSTQKTSPREIEACYRPETPWVDDDFIPQMGDSVRLKKDPSVVMNVVRISDHGEYTMFRFATAAKPASAIIYKTLARVQEDCVAHVPKQSV